MFLAQKALGVNLVDVLCARRPGCKPAIFGHHLETADGSIVARRPGEPGQDGLSGQFAGCHHLWGEFFQRSLLRGRGRGVDATVDGIAETGGEIAVMLARIASGAGQNLSGQQIHDDAIFVRRPHRAVHPQEGRARALLPAKAVRPTQQAIHEPLEAHRHLRQPPPESRGHPVDDGAGYQGLANGCVCGPVGPILEQKIDGHGQIMVGIHQSGAAGDDAVTVVVGIVAESHIKLIFEMDQTGHGVGRGAIHADLAVLVHGHKPEGGIDIGIDHLEIQAVSISDGRPIGHARAAHGIYADLQVGGGDGRHIHYICQIGHVGHDEIVLDGCLGGHGPLEGNAFDRFQSLPQDFVGPGLDRCCDVSVSRPACGGVVFEAAIIGRVVRGRDHDAVGLNVRVIPIPCENGVGDDRRGRIAPPHLHHQMHAIGGQHLDGGDEGGLREGVRVFAQKQRAADSLSSSIFGNGLADGQDVIFIEAFLQRRAPVPGCAKRNLMSWIIWIGVQCVIRCNEPRDIG